MNITEIVKAATKHATCEGRDIMQHLEFVAADESANVAFFKVK